MVDYPVNYKKPTLTDYIVDFIIDTDHVDDWNHIALGEMIVEELEQTSHNFELSDAEYAILSTALDDKIKDVFCDAIDQAIAERVESAREWREAKEEAIK